MIKFLLVVLILKILHLPICANENAFSTSTKNSNKTPVLLLLHGLNNNVKVMRDLEDELNDHFIVITLSLKGHRGIKDEINSIKRETWTKQLTDELIAIKKNYPEHPLHLIANSLGALILVSSLEKKINIPLKFKSTIFFAPAISLKYEKLITFLTKILPSSLPIPSFTPKEYKSNESINISTYKVILGMINKRKNLKTSNLRKLGKVNIFINDNDEIVSVEGLKKFIKLKRLNWTITKVTNTKSELEKTYNHLIVTKKSVGRDEWDRVMKMIRTLLD